jgi:hypothetical protein
MWNEIDITGKFAIAHVILTTQPRKLARNLASFWAAGRQLARMRAMRSITRAPILIRRSTCEELGDATFFRGLCSTAPRHASGLFTRLFVIADVLVVVAKVLVVSLTIGRVFARLGASTAPYMTWITDADTVQWHMI